MTIITGTEYKANQGKYIKRAQEGERVISAHDRIIYDIYDEIVVVEVIQVEAHYNDK